MTSAQKKIPLGTITTPSTAITKEPIFEAARGSMTIRYEFDREGISYSGGVKFERIRAYQFRAESHCTVWHIDGAYDTIVEVDGSDWIKELIAAQPADLSELFEIHHYMLYIDSTGCIEIAAQSWALLPDAKID